MFKKINIKEIRESLALLVIAAIVGTIISFVAQLFIISAKNIYDFLFNNENFIVLNKSAGISVQGGTKSKKNLIDIFKKNYRIK